MHVAEWLEQVERDYLATFVKHGGAAVKFVVGDGRLRAEVRSGLAAGAAERGYLVLSAAAAEHRFHMPQDLFFAIAAQVDWRLAARRFLLKLAELEGYRTDGVEAAEEDVLQAVAERNEVDKGYLFTGLNPRLQREVFFDVNMAKDFRMSPCRTCACPNAPRSSRIPGSRSSTGSPAPTRALRTSSRSRSTIRSTAPRRATCCAPPATGSTRSAIRAPCCCSTTLG